MARGRGITQISDGEVVAANCFFTGTKIFKVFARIKGHSAAALAHNEAATVVAIDVGSVVGGLVKPQDVALVSIGCSVGNGNRNSGATFIDF